jgi:hypothetical protein
MPSLTEEDLQAASLNPGWTNGEILAHMLFGFIILNALVPLARLWRRLPKSFSKSFARLLDVFTGPFIPLFTLTFVEIRYRAELNKSGNKIQSPLFSIGAVNFSMHKTVLMCRAIHGFDLVSG